MKMTLRLPAFLLALLALALPAAAREIHVSIAGSDTNDGSPQKPLRTISAAAQAAQPGDTVTVHAGIYRERIDPPRGGTSNDQRITYQAAPGEKVEIAGSEVVKNWTPVQDNVWKVVVPNSLFGSFNPFSDVLKGDWFHPKAFPQHTGMVYLDGTWSREASSVDEVLKGKEPLFFATVDGANTTIWARFTDGDPNQQTAEINVRRTVFYPSQTGRNYITVRGFVLRDAATPWAPPDAEQVGLIGPDWSKGWIIENNTILHARCAGISLGRFGDAMKPVESAEGFVGTTRDALRHGWDLARIGHHIVRHNTIGYCGQDGVVGAFGAIGSQIVGNNIFHIADRGEFKGDEMAGIKFHGAIDVLIQGNRIENADLGLWLDWMAQGARVSGNLFLKNGCDMMIEVDHGPFLVDNNLLLSPTNLLDVSEGGAYVHNLWAGQIRTMDNTRKTPFFPPHSTAFTDLANITGGDDRFYNNIFIGDGKFADALGLDDPKTHANFRSRGLAAYDSRKFPLYTGGNVYYWQAYPYQDENKPDLHPEIDPSLQVTDEGDHVSLRFNFGPELHQARSALVTTDTLGKSQVAHASYENADGSPLKIDVDYFGKPRAATQPTPGPFEMAGTGIQTLQVW